MDRKLIDYLPPVLREVVDFKAINAANEPEIVLAWDALNQVLDNQFLDSADESGVSVWEQELRIRPKDTDTLAVRKARIKAMWNMEMPYTLPWLKKWLTKACGEGKWSIQLEDYTLCVEVQTDYPSLSDDVIKMICRIKPANILYQPIIKTENQYTPVCVGGRHDCCMVTNLPVLEE